MFAPQLHEILTMSEVFNFGAAGNGQADDTDAIRHAIQDGDGPVIFHRGIYKITETIEVDLDKYDRTGIDGSGGTAKIVMTGPGPAFRFVGTHAATADPKGFKPNVWLKQRLPIIQNIEIEGAHAEADGIELIGTMQATLSGVLLRELRHGIRLHSRNRNVLITDCHIYHNTGVGVYCDDVNLHQFNITGNHISYNRLGGIRIEGSEIRNLQITGNDIEYNNYRSFEGFDADEPTAEIYIDSRGKPDQSPRPSVREFTISSNTIQATYSPGGANIRILGPDPTGAMPPGMCAITGNVIGSQAINVHLAGCRGVTLTGNFIYSGLAHNILVEDSDDISLGANSFGHNYWSEDREIQTNLRFVNSSDCVLSGMELRGTTSGISNWTASWATGATRKHKALVEMDTCERMTLSGCLIRDPAPIGIDIKKCKNISVHGCQIHDTREVKKMDAAIRVSDDCKTIVARDNILAKGNNSVIDGLAVEGNVVAD